MLEAAGDHLTKEHRKPHGRGANQKAMRTIGVALVVLLAGCVQGCDVPYEADGQVAGIYDALNDVDVDGYAINTTPARGYLPEAGVMRINAVEKSIDLAEVQAGWIRWTWPSEVVFERHLDKPFATAEPGVRRFLENITSATDAQITEWLRQMAPGDDMDQRARHEARIAEVDLAGLWATVVPGSVVDDVFAHWRADSRPQAGAPAETYHLRGEYPVTEVTWEAQGVMALRADPRDIAQAEWRDYPDKVYEELGGTDAMRERAAAHLEAGRKAMGLPALGDLMAFSAGGHC